MGMVNVRTANACVYVQNASRSKRFKHPEAPVWTLIYYRSHSNLQERIQACI